MRRVLLSLLLLAPALHAEMTFPGNPAFAARGDALRVNPALAAWQPLAFRADWQLVNAGLAGGPAAVGQGGFQLCVPRANLALLGDLRQTELLEESELVLDGALALRPDLSVGLELGVRRFGWNRDKLGSGALQDPVFRDGLDRLQPVLGAGLFWALRDDLHLGLGLKRLNRPSLSLVSSAPKAPVRGYLGLAWQRRQVGLGLTFDNLAEQTVGDGLWDDLSRRPRPSLQASWQALDALSLYGDLRREGLSLEFAAALAAGHRLAYRWSLPLGELAERSDGSHRLEWSYDLGGALKPGKVWLPGDEPREAADWLEALRRRWRPERAPLRLHSLSPQLETVELHVHVAPGLLEVLRDAGADPAALAASGLGADPGDLRTPDHSGVVRGTWSAGWWKLSGWLEQLAWDEGLRPVVHVGERREGLDDLANLLGAELELQPAPRLPQTGRLAVPDSLRLEPMLPVELHRLARAWRLEARMPGMPAVTRSGIGAPPALLALPLDGAALEPGEAVLRLVVDDSRGRPLADRSLRIPVVRRVRHAHLDVARPEDGPPTGVDRIHIHLDEDKQP